MCNHHHDTHNHDHCCAEDHCCHGHHHHHEHGHEHHSHDHDHGCHCHDHGDHDHCHGEEELALWRPVMSGIMLLAGLVATHLGLWPEHSCVAALWYAVAFVPVGWGVAREAVESARGGDVFSEFMLMTVAAIGAFALGEYPEAVAVMLLYQIGEALQDRAVERARSSISSLIAFRPDHAMVVDEDGKSTRNVKPDDVAVGQIIEVKAGDRVPLDGELLGGGAEFNTAALTGESVPRRIEAGGEVLAGMIAVAATVRLRVVRPAGESAVSRILSMVEDAQSRKAPAELFVRRFARIYTPVVIALAVAVTVVPWLVSLAVDGFAYEFGTWFERSLIFLVISCPCALVISIPLSYFAAIGAGSKRGILFKGGNYIDALNDVDVVAFDKTGTLTTGHFGVERIEGLSADQLLAVASIELASKHPIAGAVVEYARRYSDGEIAEMPGVESVAGYGLACGQWLVGTTRLLETRGVAYPDDLNRIPDTLVAVAHEGRYVGCIVLADTPKPDAQQAIKSLCTMRSAAGRRIESHILSGDHQQLVAKVGAMLGADHAHGDLLPQDKVAHIERLQAEGRHVAFVGDGINDAPVLALAHVGIAMGAMGADMAVETADVIVQTDQPSKVAEAIALCRRTRRIVRQNIVFAIGIKVLVMALGVLGMANMWEAVFADSGVALLAVLNSLRVMKR